MKNITSLFLVVILMSSCTKRTKEENEQWHRKSTDVKVFVRYEDNSIDTLVVNHYQAFNINLWQNGCLYGSEDLLARNVKTYRKIANQ